MMTEEPGISVTTEDHDKRKCEDFTSLYPMDNTATATPQAPAQPRSLADPNGESF